MLLILSDLHLGRAPAAESRAAERDAVAVIAAHAERLAAPEGGLILLGDVFNAWMEYRTMVPRGFVRLQGALAALVDAGVPVTYLVGNRDPWHLGHFEQEVGVRVVEGGEERRAFGRVIHLSHGDGAAPDERTANRLRPLLRSPLAYRLYRNAFPGDWGFRLARRVGARGTGAPEAPTVDGLREAARHALVASDADLVVMGHSHRAELTALPEGAYLNPGYWFADRTFATIGEEGVRLLRWTGWEALAMCDLPPAARTEPPRKGQRFSATSPSAPSLPGPNIEAVGP